MILRPALFAFIKLYILFKDVLNAHLVKEHKYGHVKTNKIQCVGYQIVKQTFDLRFNITICE